jgi:hypothetical protein
MPGSNSYRALLESVPGLSRTRVQRFLTHIFRKAPGAQIAFSDEKGRGKLCRAIAELDGHPSEELKEGLRSGEFKGLDLITSEVIAGELDEDAYVKEREYRTRINAVPRLSSNSAMRVIKHYLRIGQDKAADSMLVRLSQDGKANNVSINLSTPNPENTLYVKYNFVKVTEPLLASSKTIHQELAGAMTNLLEKSRATEEAPEGDTDATHRKAPSSTRLPANPAPSED